MDLFHPESLFRSERDRACTLVVEVVDGKAEDEIANKVNKTRDKNCLVVVKVLDNKEGASERIHEICQKFPDSNYAKKKRILRHLLIRHKSA